MIYIITGSTLGTAEYAAEELANYLQSIGQDCEQFNGPQLNEVKDAQKLIVICSTHGEGDFPQNFEEFVGDLVNSDRPFTQDNIKVHFVGIGSSDYDTYNQATKKLVSYFADHGIQPVAPVQYLDMADSSIIPEEDVVNYFKEQVAEAFLA